jgi:hypothetical protein
VFPPGEADELNVDRHPENGFGAGAAVLDPARLDLALAQTRGDSAFQLPHHDRFMFGEPEI